MSSLKAIGRHYYPFDYRELICRYAAQQSLDPLLVAALIKTESNYRTDAISTRGAVGLMQLMPETARWVAAKRGEPFNAALLFDPEANIRFGTWYLTHLRQEFGGDTLLALAAYNGGRTNVKKWLEEQTWTGRAIDLDQVPFPETRQFIRKTIWTYRIYTYLYQKVDFTPNSRQ